MKFQVLSALAITPAVLAADYQVPTLDYDNRDPTCDNVNVLIASTSSDITRLTNYVNVTLAKRSSKLNDIYASVQKTCTIIKSKKPSLVQTNNLRAEQTLSKLSKQVKKIADSVDCEKCEVFRSLVHLKTNAVSPSDLCDEVFESIVDLKNYLRFLGPAITEKYIDGILADRITDLQNFEDDCIAAECKHQEEEEEVTYDPTKCEDKTYRGFTTKTSGGGYGVIATLGSKPIAQLKEWCNTNTQCLGFSSLGYMVNAIKPYDKWDDRSNYKGYQFCVKKSVDIVGYDETN